MGIRPAIRAVLGLLLFGAGAVGMTFVLITGCSHGGACKRLLFDLGLPGSLLLSSLAQCALIFGAWLVWSVWRRPS